MFAANLMIFYNYYSQIAVIRTYCVVLCTGLQTVGIWPNQSTEVRILGPKLELC